MSLGSCLGQILGPDFLCFDFTLRETFFLLLGTPWSSRFIISLMTPAKGNSALNGSSKSPGLNLSGSDRLDFGHGLISSTNH